MADIEKQVEWVLREIDQSKTLGLSERVMYVRHHEAFDQVWFICTECVQGEHEETVPNDPLTGLRGRPKLECPWNER